MNIRPLVCMTSLLALLANGPAIRADEQGEPPLVLSAHALRPGVSESLQREAHAAIRRGIDWLLTRQQPGGHWSNPEYPALTALPLWALAEAGTDDEQALRKAVAFILDHTHEDGAIYREVGDDRRGGGLPNYNTAMCMIALNALGWPELDPVILAARRFMAENQHLTGGDVYRGGFGYDRQTGRPYADLSNTYLALEAMRLTEPVEDRRPEGTARADLDWEAAIGFLERTHNDPRVNPQPWANPDPAERGGFAYHPEQTRAGEVVDEEGIVRFRSMPGMTYAGLLSYIYAEVDRNDPRVRATVQWIERHFDLTRSIRPTGGGQRHDSHAEQEGLYYMYNVMSKGLSAYGVDVFHPEDRSPFNWREELVKRLLAEQRINAEGLGYWRNDVSRYWEGDPVLVTAYSLLALMDAANL